MPLTMREAAVVDEIAGLLYDFLPGSGNGNTAFPIAAERAGVGEFWAPGSKRPSLVQLLTLTLEHKRSRFCPLILDIVKQSMTWRRGKGNPLTREEIEHLNRLLPGIEFRIPDLCDPAFLSALPGTAPKPSEEKIDKKRIEAFSKNLIDLSQLPPQQRGYAFENFLRDLFEAYKLAPRSAFRLTGEQIDGSFSLDGETYLLEAKWQNAQTPVADLYTFAGKVGSKAVWARGLFVSQSGFTTEGLAAFGHARTSIVCMDGLDLYDLLSRQLPLDRVIGMKVRRAAETGNAFTRVRDLFPA